MISLIGFEAVTYSSRVMYGKGGDGPVKRIGRVVIGPEGLLP